MSPIHGTLCNHAETPYELSIHLDIRVIKATANHSGLGQGIIQGYPGGPHPVLGTKPLQMFEGLRPVLIGHGGVHAANTLTLRSELKKSETVRKK